MPASKLRTHYMIMSRVVLTTVFLFNALVPITASANSAGDIEAKAAAESTDENLASSITLGAPSSQPHEQVPVLSEQIAQQAQQAEEVKPVKFKVWPEPAIYIPGTPVSH